MGHRHIALYYLGSAHDERLLQQAAELCESSGAELSLVLPIVDGAVPDGCCGIQGDHWRRLTDEDTRGAARRAARVLEGLGCPPVNIAVESGPSLADIAARTAARYGCDVIAVGRKRRPWSTAGVSRRQVNELRAACPQHVVELLPQSVSPGVMSPVS
jgi:nucleotide-binding universal stress UspA family protein